jgi:hypothetical protein
LQHWHAASAFNHEAPVAITACFKQIFGDSELKIYREVAIFFAVYDLAIEGAFCYSHALRAQFLRM